MDLKRTWEVELRYRNRPLLWLWGLGGGSDGSDNLGYELELNKQIFLGDLRDWQDQRLRKGLIFRQRAAEQLAMAISRAAAHVELRYRSLGKPAWAVLVETLANEQRRRHSGPERQSTAESD